MKTGLFLVGMYWGCLQHADVGMVEEAETHVARVLAPYPRSCGRPSWPWVDCNVQQLAREVANTESGVRATKTITYGTTKPTTFFLATTWPPRTTFVSSHRSLLQKLAMSGSTIQSALFQGHQAPVLSLNVSQDDALLLSGSEDHTARLWDLRENTKRRASLCIQAGGDVLSVAFAPKHLNEASVDLSSPFARDHSIYLSVENCVYEYDLRKVTSPIINQPTHDLSPILQNQDEVNQLALAYHSPKTPSSSSSSSKGKRKNTNNKRTVSLGPPKLYIAASDDAGTLRFMDSASTNSSQVLRHDPNAVVPTCAFRPSHQRGGGGGTLELASGGTDCKVILWDVFKPK
eukprot:scaffold5682_cov140-Cylindrotheca_fusiformis.AAC.18